MQDGVGTVAQTDLSGDLGGIDDVHVDVVEGQVFLHEIGKMFLGVGHAPRRVVEERTVLFQTTEAVIFLQIGRNMNGHEVGRTHEVGGQDGLVAETEVGAGVTARFLGVIVEVSLAVFVGVVTDDLDGVLVGTYSTVSAEAVELGFESALRQDGNFLANFQGTVGHIVVDTDGELVHRFGSSEVLVNGERLSRSGVLGGETEATADDHRVEFGILEGFHDVEVQRISVGAGFFRSVEHADSLHALRHHSHEVFHAERTIEVYAHETEFLAGFVLLVDDGLDDVGDGAHSDDDVGSIGCAVEGEGSIFTTGDLAHLLHVFGHDIRKSVVVFVLQLSCLEVDVRVLCSTACYRVLWVESSVAISLQSLVVDELAEFLHVGCFNFLDLV